MDVIIPASEGAQTPDSLPGSFDLIGQTDMYQRTDIPAPPAFESTCGVI